MKLIEFLKEHGLTQIEFANLSNLTQASISRYLTFRQKPGLKALLKIKRATDGQVDAEDFAD